MLRSRLAVAAAFAVAGLVAVIGVAVAQTVTHTAEVRIVAQRLDDGRVEFGLQQREGDGWGDRILPQRRFFPMSSQGRWLSSSSIDVTIEVEATPAAMAMPDLEAITTIQVPAPGNGIEVVFLGGAGPYLTRGGGPLAPEDWAAPEDRQTFLVTEMGLIAASVAERYGITPPPVRVIVPLDFLRRPGGCLD